jgi:hypothetical protein
VAVQVAFLVTVLGREYGEYQDEDEEMEIED